MASAGFQVIEKHKSDKTKKIYKLIFDCTLTQNERVSWISIWKTNKFSARHLPCVRIFIKSAIRLLTQLRTIFIADLIDYGQTLFPARERVRRHVVRQRGPGRARV